MRVAESSLPNVLAVVILLPRLLVTWELNQRHVTERSTWDKTRNNGGRLWCPCVVL